MLIRYPPPPRRQSIIKDSYQNAKVRENFAYIKAMALLRVTKGKTLIALAPSSEIFIISICLEDRNVFAWFDEIPLMTLRYQGNCLYKNHRKLQREITPMVLAPSPYFLLVVFVLKIGMCLQGLMKFHQ